jgi:hypothetical protein
MMTGDAANHGYNRNLHEPRCDPVTPDHLIEVAFAFWRSALLLSAHDLGVFAALTKGPMDAESLIACLDLVADPAPEFLGSLVALGLLEESAGLYRNSAEVDRFLDPAQPGYIGTYLAMASSALREVTGMTNRLRAARVNETQRHTLAERMWEDIAGILRATGANEGT